jgi:hypothetical protein
LSTPFGVAPVAAAAALGKTTGEVKALQHRGLASFAWGLSLLACSDHLLDGRPGEVTHSAGGGRQRLAAGRPCLLDLAVGRLQPAKQVGGPRRGVGMLMRDAWW